MSESNSPLHWQQAVVGTTSNEADDDFVPTARAWAPIVAGLVPLGLGVLMVLQSTALGLGSLTAPGPGLWPFYLSVVLVVLSIGLLIGRERFGRCEAFTRISLLVLVGVLAIAGFIIVLPMLGFEIPGAVLVAVWLKALGRESWWITALVPLGTVVVVHLLFIELLGVPIPHLLSL
jgi:putative tricarboxylic transport membrane protein